MSIHSLKFLKLLFFLLATSVDPVRGVDGVSRGTKSCASGNEVIGDLKETSSEQDNTGSCSMAGSGALVSGSPPVVYGLITSTCTRRVVLALLEKNVEFKLEIINLAKKEQKTPEFLAKQPFGVIPVLEDDGIRVFESRAIARFISEKYSEQGTNLLGSTLKERALVNQWMEVESQNYNPPISAIVFELVIGPRYGRSPDIAKVEENAKKLERVLDIYEAHLKENEYLAGDFFSLADLTHIPYTARLMESNQSALITSRPRFLGWWVRITSRPSWQKIVNELSPQ